jgi:hypothetical protein
MVSLVSKHRKQTKALPDKNDNVDKSPPEKMMGRTKALLRK